MRVAGAMKERAAEDAQTVEFGNSDMPPVVKYDFSHHPGTYFYILNWVGKSVPMRSK